MKIIVKRAGHNEEYDERKLYASVYFAMLSVREDVGRAEETAKEVVEKVNKWLDNKQEVTSNDIRRQASKHLSKIQPQAGTQYLHHRIIW